jgi:hypothetical protein
MQQSVVKFYCFVVQTLLNMIRALLCPSSGASQTAVAASGFRMNVEVEVFSADHGIFHSLQILKMRWAGHVARMGERRRVYRVLVGKPEGKRPIGRPRLR